MNETEHADMNSVVAFTAENEERPETANMNRIDYLTLLEELNHR